jgi:hypothetical protein
MRQRDGFRQILIQLQAAGNGAGNLRHLQRVGQAGAVVIALMVHKNLGFVLQAAKGGGMDNAVAVTLKQRSPSSTSSITLRPRLSAGLQA